MEFVVRLRFSTAGVFHVGAIVAAIATAGAFIRTPARAAEPIAPAAASIHWHACPPASDAAKTGFTCASISVPLDYRSPNGPFVLLALAKHAATDPSRRIGTLFVNPGGPGGQGLVQIPAWLDFFPRPLRERFDLVSWDPRGIGSSTAVQCFPSQDAEADFLGKIPDFPLTLDEQHAYIETWARFGRRCAATNGILMAHVSTADTARDLERLRQLIGEPKLSYIGLSYGTFLGATYANLFPNRVRALVLDGNVAPSAWTATPPANPALSISLRIGSDRLQAKALDDFLTLCGQVDTTRCAFSLQTPAATHRKFAELLKRLRKGPIVLQTSHGPKTVTYTSLLSQIPEGLVIARPHPNNVLPNQSIPGWFGLAVSLEELWKARNTPPVAASAGGTGNIIPSATERYAGPEQSYSVECGDVPTPPTSAFPLLAAFVEHRDGPAGLSAVWGDEVCSTWRVKSVATYAGPWNRWTAAPILVIGNTVDPSTPLSDAIAMSKELARARLLVVRGYGHTAILNPSDCANAAIVDYVINGNLPPAGTICPQNAPPF